MNDIKDFKIKDGVLVRYEGIDSDVVIPDSITSIDNDAFFGCKSLISARFRIRL